MEIIEVKAILCLVPSIKKFYLEGTIKISDLLIKAMDLQSQRIDLPYISKKNEELSLRVGVGNIIHDANNGKIKSIILFTPLELPGKERKEFFEYVKKGNSAWTILNP